jgi:hypothetical protein
VQGGREGVKREEWCGIRKKKARGIQRGGLDIAVSGCFTSHHHTTYNVTAPLHTYIAGGHRPIIALLSAPLEHGAAELHCARSAGLVFIFKKTSSGHATYLFIIGDAKPNMKANITIDHSSNHTV